MYVLLCERVLGKVGWERGGGRVLSGTLATSLPQRPLGEFTYRMCVVLLVVVQGQYVLKVVVTTAKLLRLPTTRRAFGQLGGNT